MNRSAIRTCLVAFLAIGAIAGTAAPAFSDSKSSDQKVSAALGKPLSEAQTALKANDFATALAKVKEAQAVPSRTPFDDFTINEFLANIYIGMKDYNNAATAYEGMADSPSLPPEQKANTLSNAILLDTNANRLENVKRYGQMLVAMGPLDPKVASPLAVAYYNTGDTANALKIAQAQVDAAVAAGHTPEQGVLDIVARSQLKQNDMAGAAKTLELLAMNYGDPLVWGQTIDIAFSSKGLTDINALYLYRLRVATNAATSVDDYAIMANITNKAGYPTETVAFLEHGLSTHAITPGDKAGAMLGAARAKAAQDKATLAAFETQARAHKTGDYDVKLAETYYGYGRYADAQETASRAMSKGGIKDVAEPQMVLGMALAAQGKNADAAAAFAKVGGTANDRKIAHLWTVYAQRTYGVAAAH